MGSDAVGTLRDLTERRRILDGLIASNSCRFSKYSRRQRAGEIFNRR